MYYNQLQAKSAMPLGSNPWERCGMEADSVPELLESVKYLWHSIMMCEEFDLTRAVKDDV